MERSRRTPTGQPSLARCGAFMAELRTVTVPVLVERDDDGVWSAHAQLRPGVGAHGEGESEEAALEDLREALVGLIEEFGVPQELPVTVTA
jgi:predicted RNase H-like HicB family nuclease